MNKEVLKAMNKKEKKTSNFKKWWNKNNYKVCRVLFFYIYLPSIAYEKIKKHIRKQIAWSEEKATKALNYFLPHVLEFVEEDNAYYYCTNWHYDGWNIAKKVPFGMKKWAKKFGYETLKYLEEGYENAEFSKSIEKDYCDTWIKFEKKA